MRIMSEKDRLRKQLNEAVRAGNPATLTMEQWMATLEHFHYCCAYCLNGRSFDSLDPELVERLQFELMEHIVAIKDGGGTTVDNCIPACRSCNRRKDDKRIADPLPKHKIEWVKRDLNEFLSTAY